MTRYPFLALKFFSQSFPLASSGESPLAADPVDCDGDWRHRQNDHQISRFFSRNPASYTYSSDWSSLDNFARGREYPCLVCSLAVDESPLAGKPPAILTQFASSANNSMTGDHERYPVRGAGSRDGPRGVGMTTPAATSA